MAAISWSDVLDVDGTLTGVPAGMQAFAVGLANETVTVGKLGTEDSIRLKLARCYLAAHVALKWVRDNTDRTAGNDVQSETVGATSISTTYAQGATTFSDDELLSTPHGRAFLDMARSSAAHVGVVPRGGCGRW